MLVRVWQHRGIWSRRCPCSRRGWGQWEVSSRRVNHCFPNFWVTMVTRRYGVFLGVVLGCWWDCVAPGHGEGITLPPVLEMYFFFFFSPNVGWEQRGQCLLPLWYLQIQHSRKTQPWKAFAFHLAACCGAEPINKTPGCIPAQAPTAGYPKRGGGAENRARRHPGGAAAGMCGGNRCSPEPSSCSRCSEIINRLIAVRAGVTAGSESQRVVTAAKAVLCPAAAACRAQREQSPFALCPQGSLRAAGVWHCASTGYKPHGAS